MTVSRLSYLADSHPAMGVYSLVDPPLDELSLQRMEPLLELDDGGAVSFSYSRLPGGSALISHATGMTAQALFLGEVPKDLDGLLPVELWSSPLWDRWDDTSSAGLPPGARLPRSELATLLPHVEESKAGRLEQFLADVRALFAKSPGRQLVLLAQPDDIALFIHVACYSLPRELAARLTFISRSGDPRTAYQQIIGVPDGLASPFTEPEARYQYRVHDVIGAVRESPRAKARDSWARYLAARWLNGGPGPEEVEQVWTWESSRFALLVTDLPKGPARTPMEGPAAEPSDPPAEAETGMGRRPPITPAALFKALRSTTEIAADALNRAADVSLGDPPPELVRYLSDRLCDGDLDFIEVCGEPLAALKDSHLLEAALRDLDRRARSDPRRVLTAGGFRALKACLLQRMPPDCVHLRVLAAADDVETATDASGEYSAASLDAHASAARVESVLRGAGLADPARDGGQASALATAVSLYWSQRAIPAEDAIDLVDTLGHRWRELFDENVLDRLVRATLQASDVDETVLRLSSRLPRFQLGFRQQGALAVLRNAAELRAELGVEGLKPVVEQLALSLRDRADVEFSPAVDQWWIRRTLDALFSPGPDDLWIAAAPELAQCGNQKLLRQYAKRVWESPDLKQKMESDPELLGRAVFVWRQIPINNHHWETVCKGLLETATHLHRRGSGKRRRVEAVIDRLASE